MPTVPTCPRCVTPLPGGSWDRECPVCIARVSLAFVRRQRLKSNQLGNSTPRGAVPSRDPEAGPATRRLGDYELIEEIGRGGMGIVWRARQRSVDRIVALKLMRAADFARPEDRERFRAEAAAVASLRHPHIVALHDFGEHEGQPWSSLDFIEGPTLAELLRERSLSPQRAAELIEPVAAAIAYAHARGLLHRDIKPSNILLDLEGRPHLTDFGLAKRLTDPGADVKAQSRRETVDALTIPGQLLGTPSYAPPEQLAVRHGEIGPWSDVYSLGAVLYEMLTGRPPFAAPTVEATLLQVIDTDPVPPRRLSPDVPVDLETICLKCLAKHRAGRYASAADLAADLGRFQRGEPILARPVGPFGRVARWSRRKPGWAVAATLLLALLMATAFLSIGAVRERASVRRTLAARVEAGQPVPVGFRHAWATFSQTGFPIEAAIDGNTSSGGWGILESTDAEDKTHAQTAIFTTAADGGYAAGSLLTFRLLQHGGRQQLLGRFRLSVTTADRELLTGNMAAHIQDEVKWTVLTPRTLATASGTSLTLLDDASILATTPIPSMDVYTVSAPTMLTRITGVRLEVLPSPLHSREGPGMGFPEGNFVLTELELEISAAAVTTVDQTDLKAAGVARLVGKFVDTEFNPERWEFVVLPSAATNAETVTRMVDIAGGSAAPGTFQRTQQVLGPAGSVREILGVHLNSQAVHDPQAQGAIVRIGFAADVRTFLTESTTYGGNIIPALRQGDSLYVAREFSRPTRDDPDRTQLPSFWKEIAHQGIAASDFFRLTGPLAMDPTQHPDFTAAGAPIRFGYAVSNSHNGPNQVTREVDVDNWSVTLYSPSPVVAR